jgi:hypothetical protein
MANIKISNDNFPDIRKTNTIFLHMETNIHFSKYQRPDFVFFQLETNHSCTNNEYTDN